MTKEIAKTRNGNSLVLQQITRTLTMLGMDHAETLIYGEFVQTTGEPHDFLKYEDNRVFDVEKKRGPCRYISTYGVVDK
jgi:hypothetical protein